MTIKVILKNGIIIPIKCTGFALDRNGIGMIVGYTLDGITENKPLYINWPDVSAVVRVLSDEK